MQKSTDLRFLKKILTDTEIERVRCASEPEAALWSFWACKEAAYKVMKKQTGDAAFMPRRWSVCFRCSQPAAYRDVLHPVNQAQNQNLTAITAGYVASSGRDDIPFLLLSSPSYVHSLAADQIDSLDKVLWRVAVMPGEWDKRCAEPSAYVRSCLLDALSGFLQAKQARIKIFRAPRERGELEPPAVYLDGIKTPIDISMSHDGRFVAYAFLT